MKCQLGVDLPQNEQYGTEEKHIEKVTKKGV